MNRLQRFVISENLNRIVHESAILSYLMIILNCHINIFMYGIKLGNQFVTSLSPLCWSATMFFFLFSSLTIACP